jgi:regulator of replication initiation timing
MKQMEIDLIEYNKRINQIEEEKFNLNEEINSLQHEKKNLLIQLQLLQNRLTSDELSSSSSSKMKMEDTVQLNSSRHLPQVYRRAFERQSLSYHINDDKDEDIELNHDQEQKTFEDIIHELNILSLDQKDFLDLIGRTITKMNSYLNGSKKLVSKSKKKQTLSENCM